MEFGTTYQLSSTRMRGQRVAALVLLNLVLWLSACGGGESAGTDALPVTESLVSPATSVQPTAITTTQLSGKATYERVPHNPMTNGLMYSLTSSEPIRGVTVDLVDEDGITLATTTTDNNGIYAFPVDTGARVSVRVKAQLQREGSASWDIRVIDNVSQGALYTLASETFTVNGERMVRDLEAVTGWGTPAYTHTRAAAPFAILDTLYVSLHKLAEVNPHINLPALEVNWSVHNRPTLGSYEQGEIGSSLFRPAGGGREIYLLGSENADTDEFDQHVIAHEFAHYVHHHFGRSDSVGGSHSIGDRLDPRVAFGEGVASAFAAMFLDDPKYVDTLGFDQAAGASFDIEQANLRNKGWYNQGSVQAIVYDLYDSNRDGRDELNLGLAPMFEALTGSLKSDAAFVTVHAYLHAVKTRHPAIAGMVDSLAAEQNVRTTNSDAYGSGEVNGALRADKLLPIYQELNLDGEATTVCTLGGSSGFGTVNKLGNRRFLRFSIEQFVPNMALVITASGPAGSDPDLVLHQAGRVQSSLNAREGHEELRRIYTPGDYVLEVYEFSNTTDQPMGSVCFDLRVTRV